MAKNIDKPLDDILTNDEVKNQIIDKDGNIEIPGTPIILPGRGVSPKENEYVDTSNAEGVSTDKNRIEHLKVKNSKDVIENQLLGSFDAQGIYSLNKNIATELHEMLKVLTSQSKPEEKFLIIENEQIPYISNIIYSESVSDFSGFGKFKFAIQTYFDSKTATSELFLLEDISKAQGFSKSVNIYSVATYKANYSKEYKREMLKYFNVVSKESALKISEEEKLLFGWAYRRKLYFKNIQTLGNTKYLLAEANYLSVKLDMLSTMGAFGTTVISSFNSLKEKASKIIRKELNSRDLNDLLDIIIDQLSEKYPEMTKQYFSLIIGGTKEFQLQLSLITESNAEKAKKLINKFSDSSSSEWKYAKSRNLKNDVKATPPPVSDIKPKEKKKENINKSSLTTKSIPENKVPLEKTSPDNVDFGSALEKRKEKLALNNIALNKDNGNSSFKIRNVRKIGTNNESGS